MAHFEKTRRSQEIYNGQILRLTNDTVELENGGISQREVVHHSGGVGIAALTEQGEVYMVRQFRYPFGRELLEIPAGKLEPGEEPAEAARRELREECGLRANGMRALSPIYPTVAYDTEIIHLYLATDLHPVEAHPDDDEFLTVEKWPLEELIMKIMAGELHDGKTVAGLLQVWLTTGHGHPHG